MPRSKRSHSTSRPAPRDPRAPGLAVAFLTPLVADFEQALAGWRAVEVREGRPRYWDRGVGFVVLVDSAEAANAPARAPRRTAWGSLLWPPLAVLTGRTATEGLDLLSRQRAEAMLAECRAAIAADRAAEVRALADRLVEALLRAPTLRGAPLATQVTELLAQDRAERESTLRVERARAASTAKQRRAARRATRYITRGRALRKANPEWPLASIIARIRNEFQRQAAEAMQRASRDGSKPPPSRRLLSARAIRRHLEAAGLK